MKMHRLFAGLVAVGCILGLPSLHDAHAQQPDPNSPRWKGVVALSEFLASEGDQALSDFMEQRMATSVRKQLSDHRLLNELRKLRAGFEGVQLAGAQPLGPLTVQITLSVNKSGARRDLRFELDPQAPDRFLWIGSIGKQGADAGQAARRKSADSEANVPKLTWDNLDKQLAAAAKRGFDGAVLVVRDGKIVLNKGYGMANRERRIPNTKDTIFAIGSTPIDFTKAAILKLEELGRLKTSDKTFQYFSNVPRDKKGMSLAHLMDGRSGLPDFHHIDGVDEDHDLSWIDRDTAIKRILGQKLLFAPGKGQAHSHSAWGLLAAVVEIVSGQSYEEFLRKYFFGPAGMDRTGLYQHASNFDKREVAVGYGRSKVGKENSPVYWGKSSWLVMGSGGMVSTTGDMYKWVQAIWNEKTLSPAAKKKYWGGGVLAGGNVRGFLTMYNENPDTMFFFFSNSHATMHAPDKQLAGALERLVTSEKTPRRPGG